MVPTAERDFAERHIPQSLPRPAPSCRASHCQEQSLCYLHTRQFETGPLKHHSHPEGARMDGPCRTGLEVRGKGQGALPSRSSSCSHSNVHKTISTWPQAGIIFLIYEHPGQEGSSQLPPRCSAGLRIPPITHPCLQPSGTHDEGHLCTQGAGGDRKPSSFPQVIQNPSRIDTDISSPQLRRCPRLPPGRAVQGRMWPQPH